MLTKERTRLDLVRELLALSRPLPEIAVALALHAWDYDGAGAELTVQHLESALQRYQQGLLDASDLEEWANQIECRDDIHVDAEHAESIQEVLFELANPALTQPLDPRRARILLADLSDT